MPNWFTLTDKTTGKPADFVEIDTLMCKHFGAEINPDKWFRNWYNIHGLSIALGNDWDKTRKICGDDIVLVEITNWLEQNYTPDAWYQSKC
jgi:hypothetical protein